MDGGRIASAISPYFGLVGLAGGAGLIYTGAIGNPLFYLIMLGGAYSTTERIMGWDQRALPPGYYNLSRGSQISVFTGYLSVIMALLVAMNINNQKRKTPRQLERAAAGYKEDNFQHSWRPDSIWDTDHAKSGGVYDDYFEDNGDDNWRWR